jgi:aerobic carbon-monoxide dehydrogenase medium subunit
MKPPPFAYHDPATVSDAVALLGKLENAKLLAGGQSLMPMLAMRYVLPDHVIDLNRVDELAFIRAEQGDVRIGGMTRQRDLEFSALVAARLPLMREAIRQVGHRQTRNRGTIAGSLCHLDPAAELVAVCATHDAVITVAGPSGEREIPFGEFPLAYMTPSIGPDELVVAIRIACWPDRHGYGFEEFARRHGDFALASAAALLAADGEGRIARAALTIGGVATGPLRMSEIERALVGQVPSEALFRELAEQCRRIEAMSDVHAPASYRQQLAAVLARRALLRASERMGRA